MVAFRRWLLHIAIPFQKVLQKLTAPLPDAKWFWFYQSLEKLEVGDVLLSYEEWHLTNLFIPGFYSHAALYVGKDHGVKELEGIECVVEAIDKGVVLTPLIEFIMQKDGYSALRPREITLSTKNLVASVAIEIAKEHWPYDYGFASGNRALYCSELIWYCYSKMSSWHLFFTLKKSLGVETVVPQDFRDAAGHKLDLIFEFGVPLRELQKSS